MSQILELSLQPHLSAVLEPLKDIARRAVDDDDGKIVFEHQATHVAAETSDTLVEEEISLAEATDDPSFEAVTKVADVVRADKGQTVDKAEMDAEIADAEAESAKEREENALMVERDDHDRQSPEPLLFASSSSDTRDEGVSDEVWRELEESKRQERERQDERERQMLEVARAEEEARLRAIELEKEHQREMERIKLEIEEERRVEAIRKVEEERREQERRLAEERRKREEVAQRLREEADKARQIQARLQRLNPCPAGFNWFKHGGGWRCGGGSHFVSDAELRRNFMQ
eukprot:1952033-Rhodomonas_salina.2